MGLQTTIVIENDYLHRLEADPDLGRKLFAAIQFGTEGPVPGLDGVTLAGMSHSGDTAVYRVGGNRVSRLGGTGSCHDSDEAVIEEIARRQKQAQG